MDYIVLVYRPIQKFYEVRIHGQKDLISAMNVANGVVRTLISKGFLEPGSTLVSARPA